MRKFAPPIIAFILIAVIAVFIWPGKQTINADLTFNLLDGRKLQMADLHGKPLLVNFWSANCPVCLHDMPKLAKLQDDTREQGLQIIGVSIPQDPPPVILAMVKKLHPKHPLALDVHGEIARAFGGISVTPSTFLIDQQGKIVLSMYGALDSQGIKAHLAKL